LFSPSLNSPKISPKFPSLNPIKKENAHYVKIRNQEVKMAHLTEAQGSTTFHRQERTIDQRERMINQWQYIIIGRKYTIDQWKYTIDQ
jgi:hypothetical protein